MAGTKLKSKVCKGICGEDKPVSAFYKRQDSPDGLQIYCKECLKNYSKERFKEAKRATKDNPADGDGIRALRKINNLPPKAARPDKELPPQDRQQKKSMKAGLKFYKGCFTEMYRNLTALDLADETIRQLFGAGKTPFRSHTREDEQAEIAYQQAISELQQKMARLMLVQAMGYQYEEEKITFIKVKNKWVEKKKEIFVKHKAGEANLLIMFMTNKFPDEWKVSKELITTRKEGYDKLPGERDRKKIEALAGSILEKDTDAIEAECTVQDGLTSISGESNKASAE